MPVKKSTDEYQVKANCEKFYRRLRLRAHFHNEEASESQATPDTGHLLRQFWHFHKHSSQEFHYPGELSDSEVIRLPTYSESTEQSSTLLKK